MIGSFDHLWQSASPRRIKDCMHFSCWYSRITYYTAISLLDVGHAVDGMFIGASPLFCYVVITCSTCCPYHLVHPRIYTNIVFPVTVLRAKFFPSLWASVGRVPH